MKAIRKILFVIAMVILLLPIKSYAASNNTVNLYLFYSKTCPHCQALEETLANVIQPKYSNLNVYRFEVSTNQTNSDLMAQVAKKLGTTANGVPFTVIGTQTFIGFSPSMTPSQLENAIKVYSKEDPSTYQDPAGKLTGVIFSDGDRTYNDVVRDQTGQENVKNNSNYVIDIPLFGKTETKNLSLPILAVVIGTIDGFNPCAMWVLLFLISVLIGMKDRKRMFILGTTFLLASTLIYLVFMLAWLNFAIFIGAIWWIKLLIAAAALIGGYINLRAFIRTKDDGCEIVDESKRKKVFTRVRKFTTEKSFILAIAGVIALAVSVNFVELMCSAGLPVLFTNILALNHLSSFQYALYIFIYLFFFILDELIVFVIAMTSLRLKGISTKFGKYSHLIGGIIMLLIGILMIFRPDWLMFNF